MRRFPPATLSVPGLLLALFLLPATAVLADHTEEDTVEKSVGLAAGGKVEVETTNGSIHVSSWDSPEVRVVAHKRARADDASRARELLSETEIEVSEAGGRVRVKADLPASQSRWFHDESVTVSFEVTIPADAELDATSSNGAIDVRDLGGRTRLETKNGAIKARGVNGPLDATSNNGGITARDVHGAVNAETNNGAIEAEIVTDHLADGVRLSTHNGSVELTLEPTLAATIDARTRNGTVKSDFSGGRQDERRTTLDLDLNGGGPRIKLESTNGSIRVRER